MSFGETVLNIVFYVFAIAAIAGALGVAVSQNIVRTAFCLLAVLFSAAAIYALAQVDFIFAVQILVYVGGILVLIIFAVMLTSKISDVSISNESMPTPTALFTCLCLLLSLVTVAVTYREWKHELKPAQAYTQRIGEALMREYLYPFEIISVLLLACLIGAAFLARKEVKR